MARAPLPVWSLATARRLDRLTEAERLCGGCEPRGSGRGGGGIAADLHRRPASHIESRSIEIGRQTGADTPRWRDSGTPIAGWVRLSR